MAAALAATASFSFFLHPKDTWRITDPENWLALASFLVVSSVVGRLLILARDQAAAAEEQRRQVTTLYRLGVDLLAASEGTDATGSALSLAVAALSGSGGGIVMRSGNSAAIDSWVGAEACPGVLEESAGCLDGGITRSYSSAGRRCAITPIDTGEALVLAAPEASAAAVESIAALVALTLRHQRAVLRAARADAFRESEFLRTSLIRAISHDLNTPLTAMLLELDALERELNDPVASRMRLASLKEDAAALRHRIESLLAMARIEAGTYRVRLEPVAPAELLGGATRHLAIVAEARPVTIHVDEDCPDAMTDMTLTTEILSNLIDNANRAAPHAETIRLTGRAGQPGRVV
ncbi:MAG TPA: histidine kinase dimerization/phospho-acceptor domain-containing protein, partial [Gammaproteobacteria bacterium]|nr:histidine kinase dimerization/phospho-acceptor domain-containing protein [Gammaproteobacteria bacterium]